MEQQQSMKQQDQCPDTPGKRLWVPRGALRGVRASLGCVNLTDL
jgi:hypothetical protein